MTQLWMCAACKSLNQATSQRCYHCRADRSTNEYVDASGTANAPGRAAAPPRNPSIVGALILGTIAAVLVTALWYWWDAHETRGFFRLSWLVGVTIGVAVTLGGRGRTSFPSVLLSVLLTVAALVVGEYLLISHAIAVANAVDTDRIVV